MGKTHRSINLKSSLGLQKKSEIMGWGRLKIPDIGKRSVCSFNGNCSIPSLVVSVKAGGEEPRSLRENSTGARPG